VPELACVAEHIPSCVYMKLCNLVGSPKQTKYWSHCRIEYSYFLMNIKFNTSVFFLPITESLIETFQILQSASEVIACTHPVLHYYRFSMENLYHVVSHVEDYKYFVPWCRDSTVYERKDGHVKCKLVVGFPPLVERYISVLTLVPPNLVVVSTKYHDLFHSLIKW
jgi:hypothetical protein